MRRLRAILVHLAPETHGPPGSIGPGRVAGQAGNSNQRHRATLSAKLLVFSRIIEDLQFRNSLELAISFILMITVLLVTNHERLARYTPYFVGSLYAVNITFETPLSGMSMNPARTFGPAAYGGYWHALWIFHRTNGRHAGRR